MPIKNIVPSVMTDKVEDWRRWRNKFAVYVEHFAVGMKDLLTEIQAMQEVPDQDYIERYARRIAMVWPLQERRKLYRALTELTGGEALRVVEAVGDEDGYRAWYELHRNFEPSLKGRQGQAYTELQELSKHKAKDVIETRKLVNELTTRIKLTEDLNPKEKVSDGHARSIMLGFLDDKTREHTVEYHGSETDFVDFKNAVLKFVNNTALGSGSSKATPMQLGAVAPVAPTEPAAPMPCYYPMNTGSSSSGNGSDEDDPEKLWALKGRDTVCWGCGGKGHRMANCTAKGKGKSDGGNGGFQKVDYNKGKSTGT